MFRRGCGMLLQKALCCTLIRSTLYRRVLVNRRTPAAMIANGPRATRNSRSDINGDCRPGFNINVSINVSFSSVQDSLSRGGTAYCRTDCCNFSCARNCRLCVLQVFQTFACEDLTEINKSYLRADLRIECYTPQHMAYRVYAGVMIIICELANNQSSNYVTTGQCSERG